MEELNNYNKLVELYKLFNEDAELLKTFYANDYPVPYKGMKLYPVQVDLYYYFHLLVGCLLQPHRTSGDIKAIQMPYFKFLCYLATEKNKPEFILQLSELLLMVTKEEKEYVDELGEKHPTLEIDLDNATFTLRCEKYDSKDFDKIRQIILEQNALEMPDETLDPELVKAFKELEEYKLKQSRIKMCSFEDQINVVVAKSSYRRDEVIKMTIRSFSKLLERIDMVMSYEIKSLLIPYMDKKGQDDITHYMMNTEKTFKERCMDSFTDIDSLKNKIEGGNS